MSNPITPSSVFLVSGGAKGITAKCVITLAQRYRCNFILLGRSKFEATEPTWAQDCTDEAELKKRIMANLLAQGEKPTPMVVRRQFNRLMSQREIAETLHEVEAVGGKAEYLSADITDAQSLSEQLPSITQRTGAVTGIIHGAGVLADKRIEKKTEADFDAVYNTKVKGLESLLTCIPGRELSHLVLFSSVAGFFGNVGQSDYAMANEVLNKSAYRLKRYYPECHVVSVNWGPWDGGMVTPELKKAFADRNVEVIPVPVGTDILAEEMAHGQDIQLVVGSGLAQVASQLDETLHTHHLHRQLNEADNPFLVDHVIGEHAVLPTTCAMAWMLNSAEQLYPGYEAAQLEEVRVTKGIVFDETLADPYTLILEETAKSATDGIQMHAKITSQDAQGRPRFHYSGLVTLKPIVYPKVVPPTPTQLRATSNGHRIDGQSIYESKVLFHGSQFQGVKQVTQINEDRLSMTCRLPMLTAKAQGQFPVQTANPYLTDVMLQSMVIWVGKLKGAGSLPLYCQRVEYFQPLPFGQEFYISMTVQVATDLNLIADIVAHDAEGQLYARLTGAKVTISKSLNRLTGMG